MMKEIKNKILYLEKEHIYLNIIKIKIRLIIKIIKQLMRIMHVLHHLIVIIIVELMKIEIMIIEI